VVITAQDKINYQANNLISSPTNNHPHAISDSGATGHYIKPSNPHQKPGTSQPIITVGLPNGAHLQSTGENCMLDLPQLNKQARQAHILPELKNSSLISIGKLCDAGCIAKFDKNHVVIQQNGNTIITGDRNPTNGLWNIPLTNQRKTESPEHSCNLTAHGSTTEMSVKFMHATAFSPVASTWLKAIKKGYFQSWPMITAAAVIKYHKTTKVTVKGHMDQTRKNLNSTKRDN
jgi:hypothetical protein